MCLDNLQQYNKQVKLCVLQPHKAWYIITSDQQELLTRNTTHAYVDSMQWYVSIARLCKSDTGLDGTGQIVGMGDTGIDWYHCTFTDSAVTGPGSGPFTQDAMHYLYWANPAHRKIVYYRQVADNVDENGHGTHCAGSAVGSLQPPGGFQHAVGASLCSMCWGCSLCHLVLL